MAEIQPFQGWRYNGEKVNPGQVMTLPYDKIPPPLQKAYHEASPYNLVRVILGVDAPGDNATDNKYTRARDCLAQWRRQNILFHEKKSAIYVYEQRYRAPDTPQELVGHSFIALGKLEDFSKRTVLPHERTLAQPKVDRLNLLRTTQAHAELIFMLYEDNKNQIEPIFTSVCQETPLYDFTDAQDTQNRVWAVTDETVIRKVQAQMRDKVLLIADGHHRYETALNFKQEKGGDHAPPKYHYAPMAFVNMASSGLTILPTHRLVKNISGWNPQTLLKKCELHFFVDKVDGVSPLFLKMQENTKPHRLGAYLGGRESYLLTLKGAEELKTLAQRKIPLDVAKLDVTLLHHFILEEILDLSLESLVREENLVYMRDREKAYEAVQKGEAQGAFFLNPTRIQEVKEVCFAGHVLPQKSTDFFPKLLSGIAIYQL